MYETNDTNIVIESASSSSFVFTVFAFNILGAGEESDITSEYKQSVYKITANKVDINQLNNKEIRLLWDPDQGPSVFMALHYIWFLHISH